MIWFQMFLYVNWAQFGIVKLFLYAREGSSAQFVLDSCKYWSAPRFYVCGAGGKSPALFFFPISLPEGNNCIVLLIVLQDSDAWTC